ncbi:MAG: clostripain-related cysteine peptidase [Gammaproteobacteria bacterium]
MDTYRALHTAALAVVAALIAFSSPAFAQPAPTAKWTVMVYMSGDNNLEDYIVKDIEQELAPVGSSANVQIIALADRAPGYDTSRGNWESTKLYRVTQGMFATPEAAVADWGEKNMGDPQTLIDFVKWTRANYPAQRYALYFWGHGWNTHPGYTMSDDTSVDALDAPEIRNAQAALGFIDVVAFDGCNMAAFEVHKLWAGKATAVVASQEYVNWDGLEYEKILPQLAANPNMTADQLASISALSSQGNNERTGSAIATDARHTTLWNALDAWAVALRAALGKERKNYKSAFGATRTFWQVPYEKDLLDMVQEVNARVTDANVRSKGQALITAIQGATIAEWSTNAYADANGITIYQIDTAAQKDAYWNYYQGLGLAPSSWIAFLNDYAR